MGFFSKLFGKKETKQDLVNFPDFLQAKKFNDELKKILSSDCYLARTDYVFLIEKYKNEKQIVIFKSREDADEYLEKGCQNV